MIQLHDIAGVLWEASSELREVLDQRPVRECMLAVFFLKYVSDTVRDRTAGGPERFRVPVHARFDALMEQRLTAGNSARLERALAELEHANADKFRGLFAHLRFTSTNPNGLNERLAHVLEHVARIDLGREHPEQTVTAFELLVSRLPFASYAHAGELYTPRDITRLITELADPQPGESLYDPVSGSGSLLFACARLIHKRHSSRSYSLSGQEINHDAWMLSKLYGFVLGEDNHRIMCGDTLRNPLLSRASDTLEKFDVVVANPPFSLTNWGWEAAREDPFGRFRFGLPPRTRADYAFILHMIASMKADTGRVVTIAPHGVLFREGSEGDIRRNLVKSNLLDAVIGLPPKLFYTTTIATAILCFRAKRPQDAPILFIDASHEFGLGRRRNELRGSDVERIVDAWHDRRPVPGYSTLVSREEVAANDFNLSISRYIRDEQPPSALELSELAQRQRDLDAQLVLIRKQIDEQLAKLNALG